MSLRDDHKKLVDRLTTLASTAWKQRHEAAVALATHERIAAVCKKVADLTSALDDPELEATVREELAAAADFVREQLELPTPVKRQLELDVPDPGPADTSWLSEQLSWRVRCLDLEHPEKWDSVMDATALVALLERLRAFEKDWKSIKEESKHNHGWDDSSEWEAASRKRLADLQLDDQSNLWQLHVHRLGRLYGFRTGSVFNIIWLDIGHNVYVTKG